MLKRATYLIPLAIFTAGASGCSLSSLEKAVKGDTGSAGRKETRVDLNSAGRKRLAALPGLTDADADKIIANRPYANRRDLVRKGVLGEAQFDKLKDSVYVEHETR